MPVPSGDTAAARSALSPDFAPPSTDPATPDSTPVVVATHPPNPATAPPDPVASQPTFRRAPAILNSFSGS